MSEPFAPKPTNRFIRWVRAAVNNKTILIAVACTVGVLALVLAMDTYLGDARPQAQQNHMGINRGKKPDGTSISLLNKKAPDFQVTVAESFNKIVTLDDLLGEKPIVLVFGSFSCDCLGDQIADVERLHQRYKSLADFYFIYISEAHLYHEVRNKVTRELDEANAEDRAEMLRYNELINSSQQNTEARRELAAELRKRGLTMPMLLDDQDSSAEKAYQPWPLLLVLIDKDGNVLFEDGMLIHDGVTPPVFKNMDKTLEEHLGKPIDVAPPILAK